MLANFDLRGPTFRRWSVIAIAALEILTTIRAWIVLRPWTVLPTLGAAASVEWLGYTLLPLLPYALIYFIRVRQPAAKATSASSGEER